MNNPLQNYIEEEKKLLQKFLNERCGCLDSEEELKLKEKLGFYGREYIVNDKLLEQFLSQSLCRIAKITASEIVPEEIGEKEKYEKRYPEEWIDCCGAGEKNGFNKCLEDIQTKIKEFGI